jgi:DNA-binding MarR family transcriptional regulator
MKLIVSQRRRNICSKPALRDVSFPQFHALVWLQERGSCTVTDLAHHLGISAPSASSILDRMEERDFVHRVRSLTDRRVVHVEVSEAGRAVVEEMIGIQRDFSLRLFEVMSDEELRAVIRFGEAVRSALGRIEGGAQHEEGPPLAV